MDYYECEVNKTKLLPIYISVCQKPAKYLLVVAMFKKYNYFIHSYTKFEGV